MGNGTRVGRWICSSVVSRLAWVANAMGTASDTKHLITVANCRSCRLLVFALLEPSVWFVPMLAPSCTTEDGEVVPLCLFRLEARGNAREGEACHGRPDWPDPWALIWAENVEELTRHNRRS